MIYVISELLLVLATSKAGNTLPLDYFIVWVLMLLWWRECYSAPTPVWCYVCHAGALSGRASPLCATNINRDKNFGLLSLIPKSHHFWSPGVHLLLLLSWSLKSWNREGVADWKEQWPALLLFRRSVTFDDFAPDPPSPIFWGVWLDPFWSRAELLFILVELRIWIDVGVLNVWTFERRRHFKLRASEYVLISSCSVLCFVQLPWFNLEQYY